MKNSSHFDHILHEIKVHVFHYLFLATIGIFFLILVTLARDSHHQQFLVLLLFVSFYIFWGVIHHVTEKTFRLKIMLEYILIGAIALFILEVLLI